MGTTIFFNLMLKFYDSENMCSVGLVILNSEGRVVCKLDKASKYLYLVFRIYGKKCGK